jgi:hypothetical protein
MTRHACTLGCKPLPGTKARFHDTDEECPYSPEYNPKNPRAIDKEGNRVNGPRAQKAVPKEPSGPPPSAEPKPGEPTKPSTGGLTSSGRPAEIIPRLKTPIKPPEPQDFVVDAIHTRGPINRALLGLWQVFAWIDDWYEVAQHMPKDQFKLSENADDTIEIDPRNFYSMAVTRVCITLGCKNQLQAHHLIDTFLFFGDWGAFVVMIVKHEMFVVKTSPKLARNKLKKQVGKLSPEQKAASVLTTATTVPLSTAVTA